MSEPTEAEKRPYVTIGRNPHVHYDRRLDLYSLRGEVLKEARALRRDNKGVDHLEAVPYQWEWDENFSSIAIRSGDPERTVNRVYGFVREGEEIKLKPESKKPQ